jgi:PAS domain S-box-containing protein/putative nucleotidyltransferase with HDIG domain
MKQSSTILIVDDEPVGREILSRLLMSEGYDLLLASNGYEVLAQVAKVVPDLILLDVMMPGMDGFEVCRRLRNDPPFAEVPIFMVTALDDRSSRLRGIEAGADDFVSKPFDRNELRARVRTVTRLNRYRRLHEERNKVERLIDLSPDGILVVDTAGTIQLANPAMRRMIGTEKMRNKKVLSFVAAKQIKESFYFLKSIIRNHSQSSRFETVFVRANGQPFPVEINAGSITWDGQMSTQVIVRDISERKQAEEAIRRAHTELAEAYEATIEGWSRILDLRDNETQGHSVRVTELTLRLARAMNITEEELIHIRRGALLHDIGKMGIPDQVLLKPGPLTDEEREIMKRHPDYAYDMLSPISYLRPALEIPYCHHEKWDGTGYPRGLKGEEIPLAARIFAAVDIWDALRSNRPYRAPWAREKVLNYIASLSGTHLDPQVVTLFLKMMEYKESEA